MLEISRTRMAQEMFISFLIYFLLFIYASAFTIRQGLKKDLDLTECRNCLETNGQMDGFRKTKTKYLKNLPDNFNKYTYSRKSVGYNNLLLKGWGAGGMPFNVLYTPNIHQKKILKSLQQRKPEKEKAVTKEWKDMPEIYNLVLEEEKPSRKNWENAQKKPVTPRKYYSLIPQLFVSYGW